MQEDNTTSWLFPQELYKHIQLFNAFLSKLYVLHDRLPDQQITYDNLTFKNRFLTKSSAESKTAAIFEMTSSLVEASL